MPTTLSHLWSRVLLTCGGVLFCFALIPALAAAQTVETFTTPGTNTWTAPANVFSVTVECWGAGETNSSFSGSAFVVTE